MKWWQRKPSLTARLQQETIRTVDLRLLIQALGLFHMTIIYRIKIFICEIGGIVTVQSLDWVVQNQRKENEQ